jgi:hypothetical protein
MRSTKTKRRNRRKTLKKKLRGGEFGIPDEKCELFYNQPISTELNVHEFVLNLEELIDSPNLNEKGKKFLGNSISKLERLIKTNASLTTKQILLEKIKETIKTECYFKELNKFFISDQSRFGYHKSKYTNVKASLLPDIDMTDAFKQFLQNNRITWTCNKKVSEHKYENVKWCKATFPDGWRVDYIKGDSPLQTWNGSEYTDKEYYKLIYKVGEKEMFYIHFHGVRTGKIKNFNEHYPGDYETRYTYSGELIISMPNDSIV